MRNRSKSITLADHSISDTLKTLRQSSKPIDESIISGHSDEQILTLPKVRKSEIDDSTSGTIQRSHSINTASQATSKRKSIFSSIFGSSSNNTSKASSKKKISVDTTRKSSNSTHAPRSSEPSNLNTPISAAMTNTSSEDVASVYSSVSDKSQKINNANKTMEGDSHPAKKLDTNVHASASKADSKLSFDDKLKTVNTKRVAFKVQTFTIDPPQQIPGRNPKKGLKLLPYELSSNINIDEGIASGNHEKTHASTTQQQDITQTKEYRMIVEKYTNQIKESMQHQQSSYVRAKKLEQELEKIENGSISHNPLKELLGTPTNKSASPGNASSGSKSPVLALAESIQKVLPVPQQPSPSYLDKQKHLQHLSDPLEKRPEGPIRQASEENIIIDMPIHRHHSFVDELPTHSNLGGDVVNAGDLDERQNSGSDSSISTPSSMTTVDKNVSLDKIYTRCCHLREILPIPITLKQLKNKKSPLQILKFLNPKPTLVDILSFTDFIQCIDLKTLVFDNVSLNDAMVAIIFKAVAKLMLKNQLEKLSLKNVIINRANWLLLCKIITLSGDAFQCIDLSQTKVRKDLQDNKNYLRAEMDWDLFWFVIEKKKERESLIKNHAETKEFQLIYFNSVSPGAKYSLPPPPPEEKEKEKEKMRELKRLLKEQQAKEKSQTPQ
ncbi:hypothetical protein FOG51_00069 [Hanseniaspora uvarum]|uniref:GLC7-interacting protein 3 n=1 Tax=Hanseniaspora uvarum TaxID=29833 RepID=A0A1E5RJP3_HANUV|nr:hypothetical protein FOG48_01655 [Hanseniaspora uvarum]KAF0274891.1 hypothetical protein FOG51_00069 [Hanseniaspora uvarum]KAF0277030.1 hypothetical protein FOG50_02086 [Hanseniaspora uvarum]OEJ87139.1 GLC7-interacting protein 3 [Hanseniaspora uvarum]